MEARLLPYCFIMPLLPYCVYILDTAYYASLRIPGMCVVLMCIMYCVIRVLGQYTRKILRLL